MLLSKYCQRWHSHKWKYYFLRSQVGNRTSSCNEFNNCSVSFMFYWYFNGLKFENKAVPISVYHISRLKSKYQHKTIKEIDFFSFFAVFFFKFKIYSHNFNIGYTRLITYNLLASEYWNLNKREAYLQISKSLAKR